MELSTQTHVLFERFGFTEGLARFRAAGFTALDFSFFAPFGAALLADPAAEEKACSYRRAAEKLGICFTQTHAPFPSYSSVSEKEKAILAALAKSVTLSALLGASCMVVHPIGPVPDYVACNDALFSFLCPLAARQQLLLAAENTFGRNADGSKRVYPHSTGAGLKGLIARQKQPGLFACVDTGHAAITELRGPRETVCQLGALVRALHLHDNNGLDDLHQIPGCGVIHWPAFAAALNAVGYTGDLTLEADNYLLALPDSQSDLALAELHARLVWLRQLVCDPAAVKNPPPPPEITLPCPF